MSGKRMSSNQKMIFRLLASLMLTAVIYLLLANLLPTTGKNSTRFPILRNAFFALIFGFIPFYIMPWLSWVMGHENDQEENMEGDPKEKED